MGVDANVGLLRLNFYKIIYAIEKEMAYTSLSKERLRWLSLETSLKRSHFDRLLRDVLESL